MKNHYRTKPRSLILEYLKAHVEKRFTVKDILDKLNEADAGIDKTTVYRNLERMCQDGELLKFKETDLKAALYQYSEDHHDCHMHMHAQCSECGKIMHLENDVVDEFEKQLLSIYGIEVDPCKTNIVGICKDCKKKNANK